MADVAKLEKTLAKLTHDGAETGRVLGAAERLLAVQPTHLMALQCKVVCCMYSEKFGAAIAVLNQLEAASKGHKAPLSRPAARNARFQRAYCQYRLRQYNEAKAVLTSTADGSLKDHLPSRHLLAQVHYNLEEFEEAAEIYEKMLAAQLYNDEEEKTELITNYTAALASSTNTARTAVSVVHGADDKTADMVYNAATALIASEDFPGALKALRQAEALFAQEHPESTKVRSLESALALDAHARATLLHDPATPEYRFFNDVANTWVQTAYVHYVTHHEDDAARILELVMDARPASVVTAAMAAINWTAIRRNADFAEANKKLKAAQSPKVAPRLTSRQNLIVRYNTALLHLNAGSLSRCRKVVEAMAKDLPNSELTQSLLLIISARESKGKKQLSAGNVEALLKDLTARQQAAAAQRRSSSSPAPAGAASVVPLIAVQMFVENNDIAHALEALQNPALAEVARKPAGVATRAAWLVQLGKPHEAADLVATSVSAVSSADVQKALLAWAAHYLLSAPGDSATAAAEAAKMLQAACHHIPALAKDKELAALQGLCWAAAHRMKDAYTCLPSAAASSSSAGGAALSQNAVDALAKKQPSRAAVEAAGYHRRSELDAAGGSGSGPTAGAAPHDHTQPLKKRRHRPMRRPPKALADGGSSAKAPDPERWVPMAMRASIKDLPPKRRKELRRLRAQEQEQKRKAAERRKAEANQAGKTAEAGGSAA